jgi:YD repeat-containing protein
VRLLVTEVLKDSSGTLIRTHEQFSDGLDRVRFDESNRVLGVWTIQVTQYDGLGRKSFVYLPYSAASNGYHKLSYDLLNRPVSDQLFDSSGIFNRQTAMAYSGLSTTFTDAKLNSTTKITDVTAKLRQIIDPSPGGTTKYTYDPFGNLISSVDATGASITNSYNIRGFKTSTSDPDAGSSSFIPDSLNELVSQTDAKGETTTFGYDLVGHTGDLAIFPFTILEPIKPSWHCALPGCKEKIVQ